jgi:hypothetical protein
MRRLKLARCRGWGGTKFGGLRENAGCFGEIVDSLEDKEPRPCSAEIGYRVEEGEVCSADDGIGDLCVERGRANEHHRTEISSFLRSAIYLMKLVPTWAMMTSTK